MTDLHQSETLMLRPKPVTQTRNINASDNDAIKAEMWDIEVQRGYHFPKMVQMASSGPGQRVLELSLCVVRRF